MPVFLLAGIASYFATRLLRPTYEAAGRRSLHLTHGIFVGSWILGAVLLWSAFSDADPARRLLAAITGSVMLVAFWLWIGSILAHASGASKSGAAPQTQDISPPRP